MCACDASENPSKLRLTASLLHALFRASYYFYQHIHMSTQAPQQAININLADISTRYNTTVQRLFDIAASAVGAIRSQSEKDYVEFARSAGYLPDGRSHAKHEDIRQIAEQWVVRNILTESLNMLTPLLEDVRSVAALAHWKADGEQGPDKPRQILGAEREESLKKNFGDRIKHLRDAYEIFSFVEGVLPGLFQLNTILAQHDGKVPKEMLNGSGEWVLALVTLAVDKGDGKSQPTAQLSRTDRRFALGSTVSLGKEDVLLMVGSIGFYASTLLNSLQEYLKKSIPGEIKQG